MVLRPEPVAAALDALAPPGSAAFRVLLDPGGETFRQGRAVDLAVPGQRQLGGRSDTAAWGT